jgi:transposase InsO family protein
VLTDNGPCYKANTFARSCGQFGLKDRRTRPYTPRTNGKAERFIKTAINQWAYAYTFQNSDHRTASLPAWTTSTTATRLTPVSTNSHPSAEQVHDNNVLTHHI